MLRAPLVVVVGICASGKSTLVDGLRRHSFSALEVGQEHSSIPYLWARSDPDYLVYLDAGDDVVHARRNYLVPGRLERERHYLAYALENANLIVDTLRKDIPDVLAEVVAALEGAGIDRIGWEPDRPFQQLGRGD